MPNEEPDFLLFSTESLSFGEPRACTELHRLVSDRGTNFMHVRIAPPFSTAAWLQPGQTQHEALLTPHYEGDTIYPISSWPLYVYVFLVPEGRVVETGKVVESDLSMVCWGELYRTRKAAEAARREIADAD